jgi:two-component system, NtrC family, C4-dicarboxylate transport sensor histidine kinase DctB
MGKRNGRVTRLAGMLLAACSLIALPQATYVYVKERQLEQLHRDLASRAELYAATIGGALAKYEFLPLAIAQGDAIAGVLRQPGDEQVRRANAYLEDVNRRAGAFAVYAIGIDGTTVASSNWRDPGSYVGQNFSFRPYFTQAAGGAIGRFYGIGAATLKPGYFIAQPVRRGGKVIGVAATKVNLDWIEQSWRIPGVDEQIWVQDANGVIILSSIAEFKYRTLGTLPAAVRERMQAQRQFMHQQLQLLAHQRRRSFGDGAAVLALPRQAPADGSDDYLAVERKLAPLDWRITVLAGLGQVRAPARNAAIAAGLGWALLLLGALYARQRRRRIAERLGAQQALKRANDELEAKVAQRTADLLDANRLLQAEVRERKRAEHTLLEAQAELVQSGKLAAIGQMAAGVTHELNQPLAALQTFSDNTRVFIARGRTAEALENLSTISDLVKRLGYITSQLKAFARRSADARAPVDMRQAFAQTLLQVRTRRGSERLVVSESWPQGPVIVLCNAVGLEQVFSNLVSNAMEAVPPPGPVHLALEVRHVDGQVVARLTDNGPGIAPAALERIFDPFYTSKDHGLGLGLSISAGVIRAAGGSLHARNRDDGGGAEFTITLRCPAQEQGTPDAAN